MAQTRHFVTSQGRARILGATNTPTNSGLKGIEINKIKLSNGFSYNSYQTRDQFLALRTDTRITANNLLGSTSNTLSIDVTTDNFNIIQVTDDQVIFEVTLSEALNIPNVANNEFNEVGLYYNDNGDKLFLYAGLVDSQRVRGSNDAYIGQYAVTIGSSDSADITFSDPSVSFGKIMSTNLSSLPKANTTSATNRNLQMISGINALAFKDQKY